MRDPFLSAVRRTVKRRQMLAPGQGVVVAVSGGPDSSALLAVLAELAGEMELRLVAAHLNHALRGEESDRDEDAARNLAGRLGVTFEGERLPAGVLDRVAGGLEQAARRARYDFLHRVAAAHRCERIATGHTLDDQAETVLHRLLRGSGKAGLAGIQPVRADGVVRPLIDVGRDDVVAYLQRRGISASEDASNQDARFTRNRIRLELMPVLRRINPRVAQNLAALGDTLGGEAEVEQALARELLQQRASSGGGLALEDMRRLPSAAQRVVAREWLRRERGDLRRIEVSHLDAVVGCAASGRTLRLPGGGSVANEHGVLRYRGAEGPALPEAEVLAAGRSVRFGRRWRIGSAPIEPTAGGSDLPATLLEAVFDADRLALPLHVRRWRHGDRVHPLGMRGHRKLSDIFIDAKVPRALRTTVPVVESGGEVVWVPGLVRSDAATVTSSTVRLLRLRAERV